MGKSLTEVAKAVLMKESNDSAPDAGAKSMNPNMGTLRPGSRSMDPNPMTNTAQDLGPALVNNTDIPPSAKAAGVSKKDTSPSSQSRKGTIPAQAPEKMMAEEEDIEEGMEEMPTSDPVAPKRTVPVSRPSAGVGPGNKMMREEEELEEDIEISEELQAFIDEMIEEGYDEDQIAQAIEENFEFVTEDLDEETEEVPYYDYEVDMNEDIQALFAGEDLSEEFMNKAKTIFEAAVVAKMQSEIARLEEAYAATLEEEVETIKESLAENVDDYLNYVVENWVSENEVAIEAGLRTELTEDFISGLRQLFAEHYIDIPEDQVSVVEEMGSKIEELEIKLNEEIERNVELTNILSESVKNEIINNMTDGLTVTQAEKLKSLSEGVEFVDEESFATKIQTLRENYFPSNVKTQTELDIIVPGTEGQTMISEESNPMNKYVRALGKTLPN